MWRRKRRPRTRSVAEKQHYHNHKEAARVLVHGRLEHYNGHYGFHFNRVSIKNQRRCWGSCSSLRNLNFNYRILFLPPELQDYIVVHELCHLREMNHGRSFWSLVAQTIPQYRDCMSTLRELESEVMKLK